MHPTLNAMVAAEREVDIARTAQRRSTVAVAAPTRPRHDAPLPQPRDNGLAHALAAGETALAELVSSLVASFRRGGAGRKACCA